MDKTHKAVCTTFLFCGLVMLFLAAMSITMHWDWYNWAVGSIIQVVIGFLMVCISALVVWESA